MGHPSVLVHCLQAALDVLNAGLAQQERQDNSFVATDVIQFSPAKCWLCLKGKMSINSLLWYGTSIVILQRLVYASAFPESVVPVGSEEALGNRAHFYLKNIHGNISFFNALLVGSCEAMK